MSSVSLSFYPSDKFLGNIGLTLEFPLKQLKIEAACNLLTTLLPAHSRPAMKLLCKTNEMCEEAPGL